MNAMKNSSDDLVKRITSVENFAMEVGLKAKAGAAD
jgi:hypothetical protein